MVTTKDQGLSEREKEALRLLLVGHDAKSIANTLGLSVYTVNDRLRDARRKLGVSSSREAARRLAGMDGDAPDILGAKEIGDARIAFSVEGIDAPASPRPSKHRLAWLAGGMLIMSLIIAAVALSTMIGAREDALAFAPNAPTTAPRPAETEATSAARQWVALLDGERWDANWRAAGAIFRAQLTSAQWATTIRPVRQPLGRASSRTLRSAVRTKTLPGAPLGDYQLLEFQTRFATKPDAVETVVLSREQSGWRVDGYFIR